ncbi:MAG: Penicillin-binding protein 1C [Desulfovibrio sp.]
MCCKAASASTAGVNELGCINRVCPIVNAPYILYTNCLMGISRIFTGKRAKRLCILTAVLGVILFSSVLLAPSPMPDAVNWPVSPALLDSRGELFHARLSENEEFCLPVRLADMGKWLPLVAVEVEDRRFYSHFGVDVLALARATAQNARSFSVVSGASTITSQVIRLTYPRPRSLRSKALEFAQAIKLERHLSKEEILELYLNRAPFGGPVRGVEAAARSYFGKRAAELSLAEAALLIGMLRGPSLYRPDKNPERTLERRNAILHRLEERNAAPPETVKIAYLEKLPPGRGSIPQLHRHYADIALRALPAGYWRRGSAPVKTTLDTYLQNRLATRLTEALLPFPANITSAGAIVDNRTGAIVAYIGNSRFNLAARTNWVDCGNSPRSPGSTLKPFAYLLAMDQGKLLPSTLLADTPLSFAGMAPRNYDRTYRGPVSASFSLANSLNAPAVRVLRATGGENVIQFLRNLGFSFFNKPASHYGDSLILGGCEVTLLQVAQGFSTLATLGEHRPLTPFASESAPDRLGVRRIFSADAGYLIADSLSDAGRMSPVAAEALQSQGRRVAFKTGTSYGLRDAWTAAYTPHHTVVVWLGDPEGLPHPMLVGLPVASPAALNIIRDIPYARKDAAWYTPPPRLERFTACSFSGKPATPFCPTRNHAWRIRSVSQTVPCSMHAMRNGKLQTVLPAELENYAAENNTRVARRERIDITMPQPGMRFFITPYAEKQRIPLTCEGAQGKVYWFIDQEYYGVQEKGAALLWPVTAGKHVLSLVDEAGNTASAAFTVVDVLADSPRAIPLE